MRARAHAATKQHQDTRSLLNPAPPPPPKKMARVRAALALAALSRAAADVMVTTRYNGVSCEGNPISASAYDSSSYGCAYSLAQADTTCQVNKYDGLTSSLITCVFGAYTVPVNVAADIFYSLPSTSAPRMWKGMRLGGSTAPLSTKPPPHPLPFHP